MQEKLRKSETLAALGQLSAGVAHELGAPLSVVDGRARRLLRHAQSAKDENELTEIRGQAQRMTSIVEQLLSFARGSRAEHRQLDVESLLQRACALAVDENVWPHVERGPRAAIMGDSLGLEQALVNLLRNARQACPEGEVILGWRLIDDGRRVVIYVDDAGPGVAETDRAHIFDPFYTTKAPGEGSGLGLSIVQRIMREHGGEVRISESERGGALFELLLSLAPEEKLNES